MIGWLALLVVAGFASQAEPAAALAIGGAAVVGLVCGLLDGREGR